MTKLTGIITSESKLEGNLGVRNEINVDIIGTGPRGLPGSDGYTPVKGVDYFDGTNGKDGNDMFAFKIVDGNLIVVYQDISQSHNFSLNEAGELIYKF